MDENFEDFDEGLDDAPVYHEPEYKLSELVEINVLVEELAHRRGSHCTNFVREGFECMVSDPMMRSAREVFDAIARGDLSVVKVQAGGRPKQSDCVSATTWATASTTFSTVSTCSIIRRTLFMRRAIKRRSCGLNCDLSPRNAGHCQNRARRKSSHFSTRKSHRPHSTRRRNKAPLRKSSVRLFRVTDRASFRSISARKADRHVQDNPAEKRRRIFDGVFFGSYFFSHALAQNSVDQRGRAWKSVTRRVAIN
jgi:hypothetical protein